MSDRGGQERAWYIIRVRGVLDPDGVKWFEGFTVAHDSYGNTILSGEVVDQAAFYGLISRARDLGLTITAVERMDPERFPGERLHRPGPSAPGGAPGKRQPRPPASPRPGTDDRKGSGKA